VCGRITQYMDPFEYAQILGLFGYVAFPEPRTSGARGYNIPPGTKPLIIYPDHKMRRVHWGYRPKWAADKGLPQTINARVEKAATGPYFRALWKSGRVLLPANGWYEWTKADDGKKQPFYIHRRDGNPMFIAALTNVRGDEEPIEGAGFVVVTAAADEGLVDVHDRRPLVFEPADALKWLDPETSPEAASELAFHSSAPADVFVWHPVTRAVNPSGPDDPSFIVPIEID